MKIVAALAAYPPTTHIGAFITTAELLGHLVASGHQVTVLTTAARGPYTHNGVSVEPPSSHRLALYKAADAIITHLGGDDLPVIEARRLGKPVVRFIHGIHGNDRTRLVAHGIPALTVFPSEAARVAVKYDGPSVIVHPSAAPALYKVDPVGTEVVLVNMADDKGGKVLWKLAETLRHRAFLGVMGGYGNQIVQNRRNVVVLPPQDDMRKVYRRARVLLMPSLTETWGRVGVEAALSGIPIIASPSPGLREALGDAPEWINRYDTAAWVDAITELSLPSAWKAASERSLARAAQLDPTEGLEAFRLAVEALEAP